MPAACQVFRRMLEAPWRQAAAELNEPPKQCNADGIKRHDALGSGSSSASGLASLENFWAAFRAVTLQMVAPSKNVAAVDSCGLRCFGKPNSKKDPVDRALARPNWNRGRSKMHSTCRKSGLPRTSRTTAYWPVRLSPCTLHMCEPRQDGAHSL